MNLAILPRQKKKTTEKPLYRLWRKETMYKKRVPHPMQRHLTPRKKFRFALLPKEKNYEINTVRTYSDYQRNHKTWSRGRNEDDWQKKKNENSPNKSINDPDLSYPRTVCGPLYLTVRIFNCWLTRQFPLSRQKLHFPWRETKWKLNERCCTRL